MNFERMRSLLLQRAIEGKLLRQLESDSTNSQIGELPRDIPFWIPKNWHWELLKNITNTITDGTHHSPKNSPVRDHIYKNLYITAKNIKFTGIDLSKPTYVDDEVQAEILQRCKPEYGDVLFVKDGATTGVVTINNLNEPFSMLSSVALIKSAKGVLDSQYLVYVLRSPVVENVIRSKMKGTGITRVTLKILQNIPIPVPSIEEQRHIVARLEELLSVIDKAEKAYNELQVLSDTLRSRILQKAIEGKLVPQLDSEKAVEQIGDAPEAVPLAIPEKWKWVRFSDIATLLNGRTYSKSELLEEDSGRTPVLRVGNFFTNTSWYYSDLNLEDEKYCDTGDLLFAWSASFGPKIWDGVRCIYHYHIWKVVCSESVDKKWLYFWLLGMTDEMKNASGRGTTMTHITKKNMENELLALPPIEEQRRIVAKVESLLKEVDSIVG